MNFLHIIYTNKPKVNISCALGRFVIRWENGLGGSGGYERIFFIFLRILSRRTQKKSVWIRPIRPIRSPIVSPFPKAEIAETLIQKQIHQLFKLWTLTRRRILFQ
jgi:hypothetical protein